MESSHDYLSIFNDPKITNKFESFEIIEFSDKIHKYNCYGWKQERVIVITNFSLYNFKKKEIKRKIDIKNIGAIIIYDEKLLINNDSSNKKSLELVIHVPSEYDYRYSSPR